MRSAFLIPPLERDWAKLVSIGELKSGKQLLTLRNRVFAKKHLEDTQAFWDDVPWTDELKVEPLRRHGYHYIWHMLT